MIHKIIISKKTNTKTGKALFLDRDGVVNKKPPKSDYVKSWEEFVFNPKIFPILEKAKGHGYMVVIITNQRGISRGLYSHRKFKDITKRMVDKVTSLGGLVNAVYYCPHGLDENCDCRKPKPGLFAEAIKDFDLKREDCVFVGDSKNDIIAGKNAGIKTILVKEDLKNERVDQLLEEIFKRNDYHSNTTKN